MWSTATGPSARRPAQRVQEAIDELGYAPDLSARHLRSGRTGIIALAIPELDNPYFAELAGAAIREAAGLGLHAGHGGHRRRSGARSSW